MATTSPMRRKLIPVVGSAENNVHGRDAGRSHVLSPSRLVRLETVRFPFCARVRHAIFSVLVNVIKYYTYRHGKTGWSPPDRTVVHIRNIHQRCFSRKRALMFYRGDGARGLRAKNNNNNWFEFTIVQESLKSFLPKCYQKSLNYISIGWIHFYFLYLH